MIETRKLIPKHLHTSTGSPLIWTPIWFYRLKSNEMEPLWFCTVSFVYTEISIHFKEKRKVSSEGILKLLKHTYAQCHLYKMHRNTFIWYWWSLLKTTIIQPSNHGYPTISLTNIHNIPRTVLINFYIEYGYFVIKFNTPGLKLLHVIVKWIKLYGSILNRFFSSRTICYNFLICPPVGNFYVLLRINNRAFSRLVHPRSLCKLYNYIIFQSLDKSIVVTLVCSI